MQTNQKSNPSINTFTPGNINSAAISYINFMQRTRGAQVRASMAHNLRHIFRTPIRSFFGILLSFVCVLGLGWLYAAANSAIPALDAYGAPYIASKQIMRDPADTRIFIDWEAHFAAAPISGDTIDRLADIAEITYLEAMWQFSFVRHPLADALPPDASVGDNTHIIIGVSGLMGRADNVEFAQGFNHKAFYLMLPGDPIPIIINRELMQAQGLALGDIADIVESWAVMPPAHNARIIGVFDNYFDADVIMPLSELRAKTAGHWLFGPDYWDTGGLTYRTANIIPTGDLSQIQALLSQNTLGSAMGPMPLALQSTALQPFFAIFNFGINADPDVLRLAFPVAISLAIALAMGSSVLSMTRHAKFIAITHIFGKPAGKTRFGLFVRQIIFTLIGIVAGLSVFWFANAYEIAMVPLIIAGLYFAGALMGTIIGAIILSAKSPLEVLC